MGNNSKNDKKGSIKSFFKGVRSEIKKVNWPNKKELTNYTVVVLAICVIMTIVVWVLDLVFQGLLGIIAS